MAIDTRIIPYRGTRAALDALPTTGYPGLVLLTSDTQEWFVDQGTGSPGVGPGNAWLPVGGAAASESIGRIFLLMGA